MKKLLTLVFFAFLGITAFPQNFSGIKLLINPGHGGHDPANDRYIPETGFWESDGNLDKGLYLRDIMLSLGANIVMSRVQNNDADDLPLSQIVAMANSNNVDWMHAIHSNAYDTKSNYTLILFQGKTSAPTYKGCDVMANCLVDAIYKAQRTTSKMIAGDFDFYGTGQPYLGVFKGLNMPGTLSEGEFHDYIIGSWRLMNMSFKKHEAWAIARAFIQYWNKTPFNHGIIAGILRDKFDKTKLTALKGDENTPINYVKVTVQPGDRVYNGDNKNNGFFMIDSLMPGTYKVIFEAPNYYKDSATVTVTANTTTFQDMFMMPDTTQGPVAVSYSPSGQTVSANTQISVTFSRPMNKSSVEGAFKITPAINGTFAWSNQDQTITFSPTITFDKSTTYNVVITTDAKNMWNAPMQSECKFSFTTKDKNRINLVSTYPANNQTDISTTFQGQIITDSPILSTLSLNACVALFDDQNNRLTLKNAKRLVVNGQGVIWFEPKDELQKHKVYKVLVLGTMKDIDNLPLYDTVSVYFTTTAEKYVSGNVVDSLEAMGSWLQPKQSKNSTGIDTVVSLFSTSSTAKISGNYSGKLVYEFTKTSGGVCELSNSKKFVIPSASNANFGMWIFGDNSQNVLEYWFAGQGTDINKVVVDTINWTGWKLITVPISAIPGTGDRTFTSVVVRQTPAGVDSSNIFIEDIQYNALTPVNETNQGLTPSLFVLDQNYPNPFNPSTTISWNMPKASKVSLKVYDVLGRMIATLVDDVKPAGSYRVVFDVNRYNLASGVYLYKLQTSEFSQTRKMILNK
jgi:N-acetylmuramoyl-L-alanine amidase